MNHTFLTSTFALPLAMFVASAMSVRVPCGVVHGGATGVTPRTGPVPTGVGYDVRVITADVMLYFFLQASVRHRYMMFLALLRVFTPRSCG